MHLDNSQLVGIKDICSLFQDIGKSCGTILLFRFDPKTHVERACLVGLIAAMNVMLLIDMLHISYGISMTVTFFIVILAYWRVYRFRFSYAMLLGVTYALMQSIVGRSVSAIWRTVIEPKADFVNDYWHVYPMMIWTFVAPIVIFGWLYKKGMGFYLIQEHLELRKKDDMRILIFSIFYGIIYSLRSIYLPKAIWMVFAEPSLALYVLWVIQYKIKKDWDEHFAKINAKDLLL